MALCCQETKSVVMVSNLLENKLVRSVRMNFTDLKKEQQFSDLTGIEISIFVSFVAKDGMAGSQKEL